MLIANIVFVHVLYLSRIMRITLHEKYDANEESFVIGEHTRKRHHFGRERIFNFVGRKVRIIVIKIHVIYVISYSKWKSSIF